MSKKYYLNTGIAGGHIEAPARRGFKKIPTTNIETPAYNSAFFEAFPTVWATAHTFHRGLEQKDAVIIEEWIVLLSLHYFGVVHLETYDKEILENGNEYDWDLWKSLSITYPHKSRATKSASNQPEDKIGEKDTIKEVKLIKFDKVTIGAYYPMIFFFPSRERKLWLKSEGIKNYLSGQKLSWEKFFDIHLKNNALAREELHKHLLCVSKTVEGNALLENLDNFCKDKFGEYKDKDKIKKLDSNPDKWETLAKITGDPSDLLSVYPLKKFDPETNRTIYYLLTDFPVKSTWMNLNLGNGLPTPIAYRESSANNEISVTFAGETINCKISENDEIKLLKDFFLDTPPSWSFITGDTFVGKVMSFNQVAVNSFDRDDNKAFCLLPLNNNFLKEFPEIFDEENINRIEAKPLADGSVHWKVPVCGKSIDFEAMPELDKKITKTTAAIYPPQVSPLWKTYAVHGSSIKDSGGWHLVDEQGNSGIYQQIKDDEYGSICSDTGLLPNRPRALLYIDKNNRENGILFLKNGEIREVSGESMSSAKLAVDFGTSNTCLAYRINGKKEETLRFSMSPLFLWGEPSTIETPGFIPKQWGGEKGYFSTALYSLKKYKNLGKTLDNQLKIENIFQVDIPSLHKGIAADVARVGWEEIYNIHLNLKWGKSDDGPWRSLFLRLILFYAHAELFFLKNSFINEYVFTYPLAFGKQKKDEYQQSSVGAANWIREYCFDKSLREKNTQFSEIDESTAIAKSIDQEGQQGLLEVFIDIGGGTSDFAIRHAGNYEILDSLRVAGNTFLEFTEKNFTENPAGAALVRRHLGELLNGDDAELNMDMFHGEFKNSLRLAYSYLISSRVNDAEFKMAENKILPEDKSPSNRVLDKSYQTYRSKLFFKHIFTYSLIQLAALIVNQKINPDRGIRFILGGNGWGLLLFAGWRRSSEILKTQLNQLLMLLKEKYKTILSDEEYTFIEKMKITDIDLLNYRNFSEGKTKVALGALNAANQELNLGITSPLTGINVKKLQINEFEEANIDWSERWNVQTLRDKLKDKEGRNAIFEAIEKAELLEGSEPNAPLDGILSIFTAIGNESNLRVDNMDPNEWTKMNGKLIEKIREMQVNNERLTDAPINQFLSEILYGMQSYDYLDNLADINNRM